MKRLYLFVSLCFIASLGLYAQAKVSVFLQNNSSITINGTSNVASFKLTQSGEKLANKSFLITVSQFQNKLNLNQNQYSIAVRNFDSNNKMALRDFLKLVKSDEYPEIKIQLNYIESQTNSITNDYAKGQASVNITITGVTKRYSIPISSSKSGDLYNLTGKMKLSIKDFGLVPPVEMLGLIKVNKLIEIDFNLFCKITPSGTSRVNKGLNKAHP